MIKLLLDHNATMTGPFVSAILQRTDSYRLQWLVLEHAVSRRELLTILLCLESLGAKFVMADIKADAEGGYARELTDEEKAAQQAMLEKHIAAADSVITTAAIPGRPSPKIISKAMVESMKPGAVIVDLAAEGGGNCELTEPGKTTTVGDVTIAAPLNVPSMLAEHASEMYARNLLNLMELFIKDGELALDLEDDVIAGALLTHGGEIVHEQGKAAVK